MIEKSYVLVDTQEKLAVLIKEIKDHEIIAFDIETTSLNWRKGQIIGVSFSTKPGNGWYIPTLVYENNKLNEFYITDDGSSILSHDVVKKLLNFIVGKQKKIIGHNLSFDTKFVKCYYDIDLVPLIYVDTLLLVHTVSEEGAGVNRMTKSFGLKNIAKTIQEHIGINVEEEANAEQIELKASIKANLGSTSKENYEIFKADLQILAKYAAADTDLTLRVYLYFMEILKAEGLEKFFFEDEVMPLYREVTIPMEQVGVRLDIEKISEMKKNIDKDLKSYHNSIISTLLENEGVRSWCVLKAINTYPPSNKGTFAQELAKFYGIEFPISEKSGKYAINVETVSQLPDGKVKDYLATGDLMYLDENDVMKISMKLWKESNDGQFFNIQSKDHMGEIAFDVFGLTPLSKTKTGKPQFDEELIQSISGKHEWAKQLRIYNKLVKIGSTYVDRFLDGQEDGVYYFSYKQHGTTSGRYGSDAQQLPRPLEPGDDEEILVNYTNEVRAFFIPKENNIFIDCDYESLEPKVFSHVANDEGLKDIFRNNWDFYSTIAIRTEGLSQYSADKKAPNFLKKVAPALRNKAKGYSLGVPYGMSGYALAMTIGVNKKEGQKLVDDYLNAFPELKRWMETSRQFAKEHGWIKNEVGRIRHLPRVKQIYDRLGDGLMDFKFKRDLEQKHGKEKISDLYKDYKNGLNNAMNFQIQSLSASIVNRAAMEINREFVKRGIKGWVCAQIHDQLIMEVEYDKAKEAADLVREKMENTTSLTVDLVAPPEIAKNWRDGH
jgi:DNA polymerase I-like protein with 3'-5' exonuclease and polymerase domains